MKTLLYTLISLALNVSAYSQTNYTLSISNYEGGKWNCANYIDYNKSTIVYSFCRKGANEKLITHKRVVRDNKELWLYLSKITKARLDSLTFLLKQEKLAQKPGSARDRQCSRNKFFYDISITEKGKEYFYRFHDIYNCKPAYKDDLITSLHYLFIQLNEKYIRY